MESASYDIYALDVFVSEILLVHSFDFWYVNNSNLNRFAPPYLCQKFKTRSEV